MEAPWCVLGTLAASESKWAYGSIHLVRARTLSLTGEVAFGASIDADATIYVYYSPDGIHWDTIAYTSFAITYTVSTTQRRTKVIDVPEHGSIRVKVTNGSTADSISGAKLWYSIQSWPKKEGE